MWSHEFEERSIKHPIYYVSKLSIDALRSRIHLALIFNPKIKVVAVEIAFNHCSNVEILDHGKEEAEDSLPCLLGILNETVTEGMKYHIGTDVTEVEFVSREEPIIKWFDKTALSLEHHPEIVRMRD